MGGLVCEVISVSNPNTIEIEIGLSLSEGFVYYIRISLEVSFNIHNA